MEDYYEYLDSNGVTTLYKLIKDDTVALIDSYSVTVNGITTTLDTHINDSDIHTPISAIESMVDTKISGLVNSAPETLDTLKELSDALGNDPNFATTIANQIGSKANKDDVYTKLETNTLLEDKANSVHNHVVNDITDFPTIPTKTSQLINDSGFITSSSGVITSVSWSDITDKPNFSTVAISGSYTDLSNIPTIPTKLSDLTNDSGFAIDSNVVHKTGTEEIGGTKTFTASPFVSNYAVTNGYFTKLNTVGRNEVPSQIYHSAFRVFDKNAKTLGEYCVEKSTSGSSLLHMDVRTEDSEGNDIIESLYLNLSNDGSRVSFHPAKNNRTDLGMAHYKWANIYGTNAHIDKITCTRFTHSVNNGSVYITGGSEYDKGATLVLNGEESSGDFIINVRDKTRSLYLVGKPDGTLQWAGQDIALDGNLVHKSGTETIDGVKTFTSGPWVTNNQTTMGYSITNTALARNDVPSEYYHHTFRAYDKNNKILGEYCIEKSTNGDALLNMGVRSEDAEGTQIAYGLQFRMTNDGDVVRFIPSANNKVHLGDVGAKWLKVHSDDVVHTSGNEYISGTKLFSNTIYRYADLTTSGGEQVYRFDDTNTNACGYIYNNIHWAGNAVYNRHGAYNAKSGKSAEIDIISNDSGVGMAYVTGTASKGNLETVTSATGHTAIATMGWVNNPATATNVVHRSGDETIAGNKTFSNRVSFPSGYYITTDTNDNSLRIIRDGTNHGNNYKIIIQGNDGKIFAPNGFIGNLQGNADSATYATTQASTDNSTKIATTAWVRTYVDSVAGTNTVGSSVSAYWSNSSNVTATGQASATNGYYPYGYSEYITKTPVVGTIYSGAQLYTELNAYASAKGTVQSSGQYSTYITTVTAQATFSNPINPSGKYLCTAANTVKFRGYAPGGNSVGTASVVENTSTKSIFIRVQ